MKQFKTLIDTEQLRAELRQVRQESLTATRQGDYRTVARLTAKAAALNKAIMDAEGLAAMQD
ncbi:MAG: DUF6435 family protein [Verrucomicrobiales bacterium]|nr:DUF6435 family protein [Verrucomicrobiales bacterium]